MQVRSALPLLLLAAALQQPPVRGASAVLEQLATSQDRTITEVVTLLQGLLDKSKADGDRERDLYAKHTCYCDASGASKRAEIEALTEDIGLLGSRVEELQGSTGKLSQEVARLDSDLAANKATRNQAMQIRQTENTEFLAQEAELTAAVGQMEEAIAALAEVGADQTFSTGSPREESFLKIKGTLKQALLAASASHSQRQVTSLDAFLQAPFAGAYMAQAGEVVGILKEMRDTFEATLSAARADEAARKEAYGQFLATMTEGLAGTEASRRSKLSILSGNDADLGSKRSQLEGAQEQKEEAGDFLAKLLQRCSAKAKQYEQRVAMRREEDAALSQAVSVLNSDAAFATFGAVDATKTGAASFLQRRTVRRHRVLAVPSGVAESPREAVKVFLQRAAGSKVSPLLRRIVALLQADNPLIVVLKEIEKMLELIKAEEKADGEKLAWCTAERTVKDASIAGKANQITTLQGETDTLTTAIADPTTGLKASTAAADASLQTNYENQAKETRDRAEERRSYDESIAHMVQAEELLGSAIAVLKQYYSKIASEAPAMLLQVSRAKEEPTTPESWDDKYKGQSEVGGNRIVSMLEFILQNTKNEDVAARADEEAAEAAFEGSMQGLKDEERSLQKTLVALRQEFAETEKALMEKQKDLAATALEKEKLQAYLKQIKPGCGFLANNLATRTSGRVVEAQALSEASVLIRAAPAYREAMAV